MLVQGGVWWILLFWNQLQHKASKTTIDMNRHLSETVGSETKSMLTQNFSASGGKKSWMATDLLHFTLFVPSVSHLLTFLSSHPLHVSCSTFISNALPHPCTPSSACSLLADILSPSHTTFCQFSTSSRIQPSGHGWKMKGVLLLVLDILS